ncbi:MAG: transposase [Caldilineaceae bacterium]|nr:transposase [Caldilineaceae bacterium]
MSATVPRPEPLPAPAPLTAATVRGWQVQRTEVDRRLAPCFRRPEARQRAGAYVDGLLSDTRRKNGWQLAETAGDATLYGFQHLLARAAWSADRARDALYAYVAEYLGDSEGVVVVDETGFPKQGTHSTGVGRQSCGTLSKVGNCQVGVFLAYAGGRGHTLLDRELYLPEDWTDGPAHAGPGPGGGRHDLRPLPRTAELAGGPGAAPCAGGAPQPGYRLAVAVVLKRRTANGWTCASRGWASAGMTNSATRRRTAQLV